MTLIVVKMKNRKTFFSIISSLMVVFSLFFSSLNYAWDYRTEQRILIAVGFPYASEMQQLIKDLKHIKSTSSDLKFLNKNIETIRTLEKSESIEAKSFLAFINALYKAKQQEAEPPAFIKPLYETIKEKLSTIRVTINNIPSQDNECAKSALTRLVDAIEKQLISPYDFCDQEQDTVKKIENLNQFAEGLSYLVGSELPCYPVRVKLSYYATHKSNARAQAEAHAGVYHLFIAAYDILGKDLLSPKFQDKQYCDEIEKWISFCLNITITQVSTARTVPENTNEDVYNGTSPLFKYIRTDFLDKALLATEQSVDAEAYLLNNKWKTIYLHNKDCDDVCIRNDDDAIDVINRSALLKSQFTSTTELVEYLKKDPESSNSAFNVTTFLPTLNVNSPQLDQTIKHQGNRDCSTKDTTKPTLDQTELAQSTNTPKYLKVSCVKKKTSHFLNYVDKNKNVISIDDMNLISGILKKIEEKMLDNHEKHKETRVSCDQMSRLKKGLGFLLGNQVSECQLLDAVTNTLSLEVKCGEVSDKSSVDLNTKPMELSEISSNTISIAYAGTLVFLLEAYKILTDNTESEDSMKHADEILEWKNVFEKIISQDKQTIPLPAIDKPEGLLIKFFDIKESSGIIPKRILVDVDYVRNKSWKVIICCDKNRIISDRICIRFSDHVAHGLNIVAVIDTDGITEYTVEEDDDIMDVLSIRDYEIYIYQPSITAAITESAKHTK
ncbi:MAG: hypothetical protein QS721_08600 [Candidatus Endonucleobacter sp. (ex Gigantidas childressi)]|nr:hypothetical protein [Candidatus Endonucleobacter sp. (ex Gigantidas childressi)]